jgi:AcrR family transcriptional regulator
MTRPKRHYDRQAEIARAAAEVISTRGIRNTHLRHIARHMGVTTGTLQHYFDSKEDLLQLAANRSMDQMLARAIAESERTQGLEALHTFCELLLPLDEERRRAWQAAVAFNGATIGDQYLSDLEAARYEMTQERCSELISRLQRSGALSSKLDANQAGYGLVAFIEGLSMQLIFSRKPRKATYTRKLLQQYLQRMLDV